MGLGGGRGALKQAKMEAAEGVDLNGNAFQSNGPPRKQLMFFPVLS